MGTRNATVYLWKKSQMYEINFPRSRDCGVFISRLPALPKKTLIAPFPLVVVCAVLYTHCSFLDWIHILLSLLRYRVFLRLTHNIHLTKIPRPTAFSLPQDAV